MSSGPAWGSRIFLMLATSTIVIANYHQQSNKSVHGKDVQEQTTATFNALSPMRVPHLRHHHVTHWGPYFEDAEGQSINGLQNVALHLGSTAMLDCRVAMLADKLVMWIRRSADKVSLLTVGNSAHSSDPRYSLNFQYPNNWRLAISSVRREDRGLYVCQVSTHPPRMLTTNVTVLAPNIKIVDEVNHEVQDRYYKTGSGVELACIVRPSCPGSIVPHPVWRKNEKKLPDHVDIRRINGSDDELVTRLRIKHAKKTDDGEYSCSLGQFSTTMVHLHVLNGEKQAAVHHDQWNAARTNHRESGSFALLATFLLFLQTFNQLLVVKYH